jgi:hypothetical protein
MVVLAKPWLGPCHILVARISQFVLVARGNHQNENSGT